MPKKTGLAAATRPHVDPEQWVQDASHPPEASGGNIMRMTVDLPLELHRELKGKCGREGLKIKQVVQVLVREYLAGNIKVAKDYM